MARASAPVIFPAKTWNDANRELARAMVSTAHPTNQYSGNNSP